MSSQQIQLKHERLGDFYAWIVSGSMLIYGYSLAMSASNKPAQMMEYYRVSLDQSLMLTLFNAFFAIGGMLGSYTIESFMRITSKRKSFYISMSMIILSCTTSVIPTLPTILISRFLLGLGCGFSMIIGGIYIKKTFSERKRRSLGGIYSLSKMIGSEIALAISLILSSNQIANIHLYIFLGCGLLALLQVILTRFVLPQLAIEMMAAKKEDELMIALNTLYHESDIPKRLQQLRHLQEDQAIPLNTEERETKNRIISAIHCGFIRQFCGVPFLVVYSSQMLLAMHSPVAGEGNLMTSSWRVGSGILGVWIICLINRRKLIVFTTAFGSALCFLAAVFNSYQLTELTVASLIVYIIPTASCLEIITWYYPFECTRPVYGKYAAVFSWFGMGCLIIIPSYITAAMPNAESYPALIFFGVYLFVCVFINRAYFYDADKSVQQSEHIMESNCKIQETNT